ncbi:Transmembrane protein 93 [Penicillium longicatenatum]|uniref:Transmembrane protein 93 n=1 Tax=Penicillium longicatenatum TaxID=1561947 RepID=UPI0025486A49|nr:Transmembrane protein 93 [Penicillium longicatenatum]KAJ5636778.1 Transmembrane protein 93 [Penicillium longicatenatum]
MAPTKQELSLIINPLVPEAVQHNNRVLSSIHSLSAFLLGLSAGILALQSAAGFVFYFTGTVLLSGLFHLLLIKRSGGAGAGAFFPGAGGEIDGSIEMNPKTGVVSMDLGGRKDRRRFVLRKGAWRDVWFGGGVVSEALSGFVLGWAGVGGCFEVILVSLD